MKLKNGPNAYSIAYQRQVKCGDTVRVWNSSEKRFMSVRTIAGPFLTKDENSIELVWCLNYYHPLALPLFMASARWDKHFKNGKGHWVV